MQQPGSGTKGDLSFVAELWREVGRHLELQACVRGIAPRLATRWPVEQLLVRRLDREPTRLTTVASASCGEQPVLEAHSARTTCNAAASAALERFLKAGVPRVLQAAEPTPLSAALLPAGLVGSAIACPLLGADRALGVALLVGRRAQALSAAHAQSAQVLLEPLSVALENDQRLSELVRMREALEADRRALLSRLERQDISDTVVGESAGLHAVMQRVKQVAPTDAPVLVLGETGSGKEVIARAIHTQSRRAAGPVVRVNCGAIPAQLIDSELFGHERGSFTGAVATRKGWFERADGGTLFLDEIGELPLEAQVRLLRVLQDGSLERVGATQAISVDVRIVAATHRNLESMVAEGKFREDLWYRISVFPIRLPALRERQADIPALAAYFAQRAGQRLGGSALVPSEQDVALLLRYPWPGNVRELAAVIERAAILGNGKHLEVAQALGSQQPSAPPGGSRSEAPPPSAAAVAAARPAAGSHGPAAASSSPGEVARLDGVMIGHIERALQASHGRIEGPFGAARMLGINPHTLRARMRKLGIDWARFRHLSS